MSIEKLFPFLPKKHFKWHLTALQAYFIEQPLLVNEITKNFAAASDKTLASAFEIQIELHTETQIDEGDDQRISTYSNIQ